MGIPSDPLTAVALSAGGRLAGTDPSGGFAFDLDLSVPWLATAIHAGHGVRGELAALMTISETARLSEEDAATERIIQDCSSTVWGLDSRAEYDLNRAPEEALPLMPEQFWGVRVYGSLPGEAMNRRSLDKYAAFYRFVAAVIQVLLDRFGGCVVYDIHSYNIRRQIDRGHSSPPLFNLGTRGIDRIRWERAVVSWLDRLGQIHLPGRVTTVAENGVFGGGGAFCRQLSARDPRILVLPTEISKIYMDEQRGIIDDAMVAVLKREVAAAVAAHGAECRRAYFNRIE